MRQFGADPDATEADQDLLKKKYHQAVVVALVAATKPFWPNGFYGALVLKDLFCLLEDSSQPKLLSTDALSGDKQIKDALRARFVLGVIYRAARDGVSRKKVLAGLDHIVTVNPDLWREWTKLVPKAQREEAVRAGRKLEDWRYPTDDEALIKHFRAGYGQKL
jgi:hypothetical protein